MSLALSAVGFLLVMGSTVWYFLVINEEKVPVGVGPYAAVLATGGIASVAGVGLGPSIATVGLSATTALTSAFMLWLLSQRRLPDGALVAEVGAPMPAFEAVDGQGQPFDLQSMKGRRLMVKFFRGSW